MDKSNSIVINRKATKMIKPSWSMFYGINLLMCGWKGLKNIGSGCGFPLGEKFSTELNKTHQSLSF